MLPAEHNGFDGYVGRHDNVHYVQARDFTLAGLPDDHYTYAFSFGTLCHITFDGIAEYAQASHRKMRPGAHGFWMIADYAKRNAAAKNINGYSPWSRLAPTRPRFATGLLRALAWVDVPHHAISADADEEPSPGRWFDAGTERTCEMLEQVGFEVVDPDMGVNHRDPVIHFVRP